MKTKKLLSILLLTTLLLNTTNISFAQEKQENNNAQNLIIPAFPEDKVEKNKDWSEIDWERKTILPEDKGKYQEEFEKLIEKGEVEKIKNLEMKKTSMFEDKSLETYKVPKEIKKVVKEFYEDKKSGYTIQSTEDKNILKQKIKQAQKKLNSGENFEVQEFETKENQIQRNQEIEKEEELPKIDLKEFKKTKNIKFENIDTQENKNTNIKAEKIEEEKKTSLQSIEDNVVDYYENINKNSTEFALYYLSNIQNEDGSIGNNSKSRDTFEFLQMLKDFNRTDNKQYLKAQNYFVNLEPKNNLELIYKISILKDKEQDYSSLLDTLITQINPDSGVGIVEGYNSDLFTSIEATNLFAKLLDTNNYGNILNYIVSKVPETGIINYYKDGKDNSFYLAKKILDVFDAGTFAEKEFYQTKVLNNIKNETVQTNIIKKSIYGLVLESEQNYEQAKSLKNQLKSEQIYDGSFGDILTTIYATKFIADADLVIENVEKVGDLIHNSKMNFSLILKNKGYKKAKNINLDVFTNNYHYNLEKINIISELDQNGFLNINYTNENTSRFKGNIKFDFFINSDSDKDYTNNWYTKIFNFADNQNKAVLPIYFVAYSHETTNGLGINIRWPENDDADLKSYVVLYKNPSDSEWMQVKLNKDIYSNGAFVNGFNEGEIIQVTMGVISNNNPDIVTKFSNYAEFEITSNSNPKTSIVSGKISNSNEESISNGLLKTYGNNTYSDYDGYFSIDTKQGKNTIFLDQTGYEDFKYKIKPNGTDEISSLNIITKLKNDSEKPILSNLKFSDNFVVKNRKSKDIIVSGTDNIGIKEFDLYYFDPSYNSWIYENTVSSDYGVGTYTWNIGEELLGIGYKLKAKAIDYVGNESESLEYGPFEIVDGSSPEGTIEITGLEEGNKWKLGDTKEFNWNLNLSNDLMEIVNVNLYYGESIEVIEHSMENITKTSKSYTISFDSKYITNNAYISFLACDIKNNCSTLKSPTFEIYEEDFIPKGPWGSPNSMGININNGDYNRFFSNIFFGENNTIEIIYSEFNMYTGRDNKLIYRKFENGSWGNEITLKQTSNSDSGPSYSFNGIKSVKYGNKVGVTYSYRYKNLDIPGFGYDETEIYYIEIENGLMKPLKQISNDSTLSYHPELEFDENNVYIIWKEGYSFATESGDRKLKYRKGNTNGVFTDITTLTDTSASYFDLKFQNNKLFLSYVFEDNLLFKDYNYKTNTWNNEIILTPINGVIENKIFNRNETEIYDLFIKKITPNTTGIEKYYLIHKKFDLSSGNPNLLLEKNITVPSNMESLQKYTIKPKNNNTYHIIYTRLSQTPNGDKINMHYTQYLDNINDNYLIISPATNMLSGSDYLFSNKIGDTLKLAYLTTIGGTNKIQYVNGDFSPDPPESSDFSFDGIDIDVNLNLNEFRITFYIFGYKFSFWIDLF